MDSRGDPLRRLRSHLCALTTDGHYSAAKLTKQAATAGGRRRPVTRAAAGIYKGPTKHLLHGRDAAYQADRRSVSQVRLTDTYYGGSVPGVADPLPRWATVPPGEKLRYEHSLSSVGVSHVPPGQRGLHIARGALSQHVVQPLGELDSELLSERALPVLVAAGAMQGPTLMLIAGEHGNEYESIAAVQTLLQELDTATLRGRVVGVPVTSVDSFLAHQRIAEDDGKNLARCWPGRADGSISERVAFALCRDFLNVPAPHKPAFMVALHTYAHGTGSPKGATLAGYNIYTAACVKPSRCKVV